MNKYTIGAAFGAAALVVGTTVGIESAQRSFYPPEYGADYLKSLGHQNIQGGERDYVNMCGKGVFARHYQTINAGKHGEVTVCFSPFIGRHLSMIG